MSSKEPRDNEDKSLVEELVLPQGFVTSFDGADYPRLRSLNCSARKCESLRLVDNRLLEELDCSINLLESLDVSPCENLNLLDCSFNALTELFLPSASDLEKLDCSDNRLSSVDLSGATGIREIYCEANQELSALYFPRMNGKPVRVEFLDISYTALTAEWLAAPDRFFPLPEDGCEDQLFVFGSPLAGQADAVALLEKMGWKPQVTEE